MGKYVIWGELVLTAQSYNNTNLSHRVTELQSDRHPKGTHYTGGLNFFVPDFNKLPYSLRSQGDNNSTNTNVVHALKQNNWNLHQYAANQFVQLHLYYWINLKNVRQNHIIGLLLHLKICFTCLYVFGKWRGIVVSMMACSLEDLGSIPCLAKVHNDVILFLGVFMIQFNLI